MSIWRDLVLRISICDRIILRMSKNRLVATWLEWNWANLAAGRSAAWPGELGHPRSQGFLPEPLAWPVGQCGDLVLSLSDGSRLHAHDTCDGGHIVHRDIHDPGRGLGSMLRHVFEETPVPWLLVGAAALIGLAGS